MTKRLLAALALSVPLLVEPLQAAPAGECEACQSVLRDIHRALRQRCDLVPPKEELRERRIYLFLSIFQETSQGITPEMRKQIVDAALNGMSCNDPDAGIEAAQKVAAQLMRAPASK